MGDFNLPRLYTTSEANNTLKPNPLNSFMFSHMPIYQCVNFPTRGGNILDLILTNDNRLVENISPDPPMGNRDHVVISGNMRLISSKRNGIIVFKNFKKANYEKISEFILKNLKLDCNDTLENSLLYFNNIISITVDAFIPESRLIVHKKRLLSVPDLKLYKRFHRCYRKYLITNKIDYFNQYKALKSRFKMNLKFKESEREKRLMQNTSRLAFFHYIKKLIKPQEFQINIKDAT